MSRVPTVLWIAKLRVVIYLNDHREAHVHVIGRGCEAVFELNCASGPVVLRENYGFKRQEISRIKRALNGAISHLCEAWEDIHGRA